MKALILSVSAGGGHKRTAEAIKNHILINSPDSEIKVLDTLRYIHPFLDMIIVGTYLNSIKIKPSLYGKLYDFTEHNTGIVLFSNIVSHIVASSLLPLIKEFDPDIIISTHSFATGLITSLKKRKKINIPSVCVITDYAVHTFWIHANIDGYIVSNDDMLPQMVLKGVPGEIVHPLGLPVDPFFTKKDNKKNVFESLNLDPNKKTLLIMGGSLGMGKIADIYVELTKLKKDVQIIVITGSNKKLFNNLNKLKSSSTKETRIIGYTEEVNNYMCCCDLLLTKPGGLTITEALMCNTPMAIFSPIPGQEEKNAEFLYRHNLAIELNSSDCHELIDSLLDDTNKLEEMKANLVKYAKPEAGNNIVLLLQKLISNS